MKTKKFFKKGRWIKWILFVLLITGTVLIIVFSDKLFGRKVGVDPVTGAITWDPKSIFDILVENNATIMGNDVLHYLCTHLPRNLLRSVEIVGFAVALGVALHYLALISFRSKRGLTISKLIANFLKWAIALTALFFILDAWGADTTTMLVSAGVVTLIIGLGSQSLVADILAGIFVVFEGEFQVGDIVILDGWRGEVTQIGIRTTRLIDAGGNVKIVNNSEIKTIINQTKELSLAKCYACISYGVPIEKVEAVIADNLDKIKANIPAIIEGPFYKGVAELGESSVSLLFVAKCDENDLYQVQRDLNREIKILFDNNNIEIPFNQLVVHMAKDEEKEQATVREVRKAAKFAEEQKELSKELDIQKE